MILRRGVGGGAGGGGLLLHRKRLRGLLGKKRILMERLGKMRPDQLPMAISLQQVYREEIRTDTFLLKSLKTLYFEIQRNCVSFVVKFQSSKSSRRSRDIL